MKQRSKWYGTEATRERALLYLLLSVNQIPQWVIGGLAMIYRVAALSAILLAGVISWGQEVKQETPGCLETKNDPNGPCAITSTLPNGDILSRRADGTIWLTVGKYRFQTAGENAGQVTGTFITNIVTKLPQPPDIIEVPQFERVEIYGNCAAKTYQIWDIGITDPHGNFQTTGPDDVTRRVMPNTPIETVFNLTCASARPSKENTWNGNCHNDGPKSADCNASARAKEPVKPTQTVAAYIMSWEMQNDACTGGDQRACRFRDATLLEIESQGWCLSATQKWQPDQCKPPELKNGLNLGFRTYTNNRYGFRVDYPDMFTPERPPDNGDGLNFESRDGKATLAASGENNDGFTLKDEFDSAIKNVHGQLGYHKMGGGWFVVTWTDGDNIGYTKEFVGQGSQDSFTITFPVEQKSQYDSVVTAIEKSFQPGDLDNSH